MLPMYIGNIEISNVSMNNNFVTKFIEYWQYKKGIMI